MQKIIKKLIVSTMSIILSTSILPIQSSFALPKDINNSNAEIMNESMSDKGINEEFKILEEQEESKSEESQDLNQQEVLQEEQGFEIEERIDEWKSIPMFESSYSNKAPSRSNGDAIYLPEGYGSYYTYMGWQLITCTTSLQYKLREMAGMNFDSEGFGKINGRYVVATTLYYGKVGDYIDVYLNNGQIIKAIIGDIKSYGDDGCNQWGHNNGANVVEFVVDTETWYGPPWHVNPGNSTCHPEWSGTTTKKIVNGGSYFDNPYYGTDLIKELVAIKEESKNRYAVLYDIGELHFQLGNETDASKGSVVQIYKIESDSYNSVQELPWYNQRNSIKKITTSNFNCPESFKYWFYNCPNLISADLNSWDTSNVVDMSSMFYGCKSLSLIKINNWNTGNVINMNNMFYGCSSLEAIDTANWNMNKATSLGIIQSPNDISVVSGKTVQFSIKATGTNVSYKWQYTTDNGQTWNNIYNNDTAKTASLTFSMNPLYDGRLYRCIVSDKTGSKYSTKAKLNCTLGIIENPKDIAEVQGKAFSLRVKAIGDNLKYQWQYTADEGKNWKNVNEESGKSATLKLTMDGHFNGRQYRCVVSNSQGVLYTKRANIACILGITKNPTSIDTFLGATVNLPVNAIGSNLKYQWQYRVNSNMTWQNVTNNDSANTSNLSLKISSISSSYYRCIISNGKGKIFSSPAYINCVVWYSKHPSDVKISGENNQEVSFSASIASYKIAPSTFKWQYTDDGGKTWNTANGKIVEDSYQTTLTVSLNKANIGRQYRCIASCKYGTLYSMRATVK